MKKKQPMQNNSTENCECYEIGLRSTAAAAASLRQPLFSSCCEINIDGWIGAAL